MTKPPRSLLDNRRRILYNQKQWAAAGAEQRSPDGWVPMVSKGLRRADGQGNKGTGRTECLSGLAAVHG
jgi:hypothetical protein